MEEKDIHKYFENLEIKRPHHFVGATFSSSLYYSEYNKTIEPKNMVIRLHDDNMQVKQEDIDKMNEITDRLHRENIEKIIEELEQKDKEKKLEREQEIQNYRLYYLYRLYDCCFRYY